MSPIRELPYESRLRRYSFNITFRHLTDSVATAECCHAIRSLVAADFVLDCWHYSSEVVAFVDLSSSPSSKLAVARVPGHHAAWSRSPSIHPVTAAWVDLEDSPTFHSSMNRSSTNVLKFPS